LYPPRHARLDKQKRNEKFPQTEHWEENMIRYSAEEKASMFEDGKACGKGSGSMSAKQGQRSDFFKKVRKET
jgi:hypothetical protein